MGEGKIDWITAVRGRPKPVEQKPWHGISSHKVKRIKIKCTGPQRCKKKLKRLWKDRGIKAFGQPWYYEY